MSNREYRAVLLTADEAERLTRDSKNERFRCCPHLDVFHDSGNRSDGSRWRHCSFLGCKCEGEDTMDEPHIVARRKTEALLARHERLRIAESWLLLGLAIGATAGWLLS